MLPPQPSFFENAVYWAVFVATLLMVGLGSEVWIAIGLMLKIGFPFYLSAVRIFLYDPSWTRRVSYAGLYLAGGLAQTGYIGVISGLFSVVFCAVFRIQTPPEFFALWLMALIGIGTSIVIGTPAMLWTLYCRDSMYIVANLRQALFEVLRHHRHPHLNYAFLIELPTYLLILIASAFVPGTLICVLVIEICSFLRLVNPTPAQNWIITGSTIVAGFVCLGLTHLSEILRNQKQTSKNDHETSPQEIWPREVMHAIAYGRSKSPPG